MIMMKNRNRLTNEKGLTLVEILAAIVIISIIFISIITILNLTAKSNRTSKEIIDATYIAQREMEYIYKVSEENSSFDSLDDYTDKSEEGNWIVYRKESKHAEQAGYAIEVKEDRTDDPMIRIIVRVFENGDKAKANPKAQMETLLKWGEEHVEDSP